MKLFKKRNSSLVDPGALNKLGNVLDQRQRKMAAYLGQQTRSWNRSAKITALVIFCLLFGGIYLLLLIHAIHH